MKDTKAAEKFALMRAEYVRTMEKDAPMLANLTKNVYNLALRVISTLPNDTIQSVFCTALVYNERVEPEMYVASIPQEESLCASFHIVTGDEEKARNTLLGTTSQYREWESMWALFNAIGIKLEAIGFNILDDSYVTLWTSSDISDYKELFTSAYGKHFIELTPLSVKICMNFFDETDD